MIHILLLPTCFFPLKLIEILFLHYKFLFKTCSKSVTTCCHFPWTSAFVSEHHCDSYMILFIHNSNVRDIQVYDCICAEPSCEIDAEPCASFMLFALFALRVMSIWVFVIMITLSVCCSSAVIWKVNNIVSDLEGRRRRWSIISQSEQFFWNDFFFPNFPHATNVLHHVLLNYANVYQVTWHKIQGIISYDTKYKIIYEVTEWTFPEFWITFFFYF